MQEHTEHNATIRLTRTYTMAPEEEQQRASEHLRTLLEAWKAAAHAYTEMIHTRAALEGSAIEWWNAVVQETYAPASPRLRQLAWEKLQVLIETDTASRQATTERLVYARNAFLFEANRQRNKTALP